MLILLIIIRGIWFVQSYDANMFKTIYKLLEVKKDIFKKGNINRKVGRKLLKKCWSPCLLPPFFGNDGTIKS